MIIERPTRPWNDEEDDVKGWEVPASSLHQVLNSLPEGDEIVWVAVKDRETNLHLDPERYALYIHKGPKSQEREQRRVFCYYGGDPNISDGDDDGWFDDFPPIPPGS